GLGRDQDFHARRAGSEEDPASDEQVEDDEQARDAGEHDAQRADLGEGGLGKDVAGLEEVGGGVEPARGDGQGREQVAVDQAHQEPEDAQRRDGEAGEVDRFGDLCERCRGAGGGGGGGGRGGGRGAAAAEVG